MSKLDFLSNVSPELIETLYVAWQNKPASVSSEWQIFFTGFALGGDSVAPNSEVLHFSEIHALKISAVQSLLYRYRSIGHLLACTDPLSPCLLSHPLLELSSFDLNDDDLDNVFPTRRFFKKNSTLRQVVDILRETYCREIGVEFMHIQDPDERQWLIDRMEPCLNRSEIDHTERFRLLQKLYEANLFETFLQRRFPGQKRFSLEGGESLMVALDVLARSAAADNVKDIILGMAHRGRLNVLANFFGKPYENIFAEFRDLSDAGFVGDGDVKYHKGYSADVQFEGRSMHLTMASNPSHLEAVNSVVEGKCRARQERTEMGSKAVLPLLIHGDAAFSGQGSVMETLSLSALEGYGTGGTIHIVLNNQIGFTTQPKDSRSTLYATDVAKLLACPIFHVQGESPESIRHSIILAFKYRQQFGKDVVVELVCYRRHGHNEGDEPAFTQPEMYSKIAIRPTVNQIYAAQLIDSGFSKDSLTILQESVQKRLETAFGSEPKPKKIGYTDIWSKITPGYNDDPVSTSVSAEKILILARRTAEIPPDFSPHPKLVAMLQKRFESVLKGGLIDWGTGESLAFASILNDGYTVRLSGQDSRRGTFSHRHAVLHDIHNDKTYTPLDSVISGNARFSVWNSPLSEFGVLGFEYGYSLETPYALTIWEAQFGDFANGAQVIIDQFVSSGETKWNRATGLVMMLPHGYEGMGAEHSSARIERFLQLCANNNLILANPTTPGQLFHLLRRQILQSFRKPLIIFTPKSLLRHPDCVSPVSELSEGSFSPVIDDNLPYDTVEKVILCSGKIYYDLLSERVRHGNQKTAIIRIEQLYPFAEKHLRKIVALYPNSVSYFWVQEEPENMGAFGALSNALNAICGSIRLIARPLDSCPAVASHAIHKEQFLSILKRAFE